IGVAETRALPAAEAMIGDRHRDRHVDADHADIDALREFARGVTIARENRHAIAILVCARQAQSGLEIGGSDDLQHGTEDFLAIGAHGSRDAVEQRWADEKSVLMSL